MSNKSTIHENIRVRKANLHDMEAVFCLVQELAEYENSSHMVKVDVPYYKTEFEKTPFIQSLQKWTIKSLVPVYII